MRLAVWSGLASNTARVSNALVEALYEKHSDLDVQTLDLFAADLPSVAGATIESKYKLMTGQALDEKADDSDVEPVHPLRPEVLHRCDRAAGIPVPIRRQRTSGGPRQRQER
ncbi:MAG: hypothetical protein ABI838_03130 [Chloroflexota bacterium]